MPTFTIDAENNVTVFGSSQGASENGKGTETFSSAEELAALATRWPGTRLVEIWNSLPGAQPVERFTSRQVAMTRIWKAIQHLQPGGGAQRRRVAAKQSSAKKTASRKTQPAVRENGSVAGFGTEQELAEKTSFPKP